MMNKTMLSLLLAGGLCLTAAMPATSALADSRGWNRHHHGYRHWSPRYYGSYRAYDGYLSYRPSYYYSDFGWRYYRSYRYARPYYYSSSRGRDFCDY